MSTPSRLRPGLCSVTLRQLPPDAVVDLCGACDLEGVEWAADVHVPPGDPDAAASTRARCTEAGLAIAGYGSYAWARTRPEDAGWIGGDHSWSASLVTAQALGAPTIRVWAGTRGSSDTGPADRARVAAQLRDFAGEASELRIRVSIEHHQGTLTDTAGSTVALLAEADHPNLFAHWQPLCELADDDKLADLAAVAGSGRLSNLHVFSWGPDYGRLPLEAGAGYWRAALAVAADAPSAVDRWALLEFVADDDPDRLRDDAVTLRRWLGAESSP